MENNNNKSAEEFYIENYGVCPSVEQKVALHSFFDMIEFAINYNHLQETTSKEIHDLIIAKDELFDEALKLKQQIESLLGVIESQKQTHDL